MEVGVKSPGYLEWEWENGTQNGIFWVEKVMIRILGFEVWRYGIFLDACWHLRHQWKSLRIMWDNIPYTQLRKLHNHVWSSKIPAGFNVFGKLIQYHQGFSKVSTDLGGQDRALLKMMMEDARRASHSKLAMPWYTGTLHFFQPEPNANSSSGRSVKKNVSKGQPFWEMKVT